MVCMLNCWRTLYRIPSEVRVLWEVWGLLNHIHEVTYYYWCWCSILGDLIILVDSLSISLGMGLSVTPKAGVKLPGCLWGTVAQWPEHLQLKQEVLGSWVRFLVAALGFFSSSWLNNVDGMKDLWCSSTAWLLSTQIWMERSMVL